MSTRKRRLSDMEQDEIDLIRFAYEQDPEISVRHLAEREGLSESSLRTYAKRHGWMRAQPAPRPSRHDTGGVVPPAGGGLLGNALAAIDRVENALNHNEGGVSLITPTTLRILAATLRAALDIVIRSGRVTVAERKSVLLSPGFRALRGKFPDLSEDGYQSDDTVAKLHIQAAVLTRPPFSSLRSSAYKARFGAVKRALKAAPPLKRDDPCEQGPRAGDLADRIAELANKIILLGPYISTRRDQDTKDLAEATRDAARVLETSSEASILPGTSGDRERYYLFDAITHVDRLAYELLDRQPEVSALRKLAKQAIEHVFVGGQP